MATKAMGSRSTRPSTSDNYNEQPLCRWIWSPKSYWNPKVKSSLYFFLTLFEKDYNNFAFRSNSIQDESAISGGESDGEKTLDLSISKEPDVQVRIKTIPNTIVITQN